MGKKYCIKHNDNIAYCVCKHCPCEVLEKIDEILSACQARNYVLKQDLHEIKEMIEGALKCEQ